MKNFFFTLLCCLSVTFAFGQTNTYSKWMVEAQGSNAIKGTYDYHYAGNYSQTDATKTDSYTKDKWNYVSGLVSKALLKYYKQYPSTGTGSGSAFALAKDYADGGTINADGSIGSFTKGSIDAIATSKILIDIYQQTHIEKYKLAADWTINYLRNDYKRINQDLGRGGFWHKDIYPNQMWLDGLYMGTAYYAEYINAFDADNKDAWTDIANQFITIDQHTWDATKKLHYHAWAANVDANSFWAGSWNSSYNKWTAASTGGSGHSREFWGRGIGWFFAALVDVLEFMPKTHEKYNDVKNILVKVADGLKGRQDATAGVWCQLLQYSEGTQFEKGSYSSGISSDKNTSTTKIANYFEASASCMFTYAYYKAVRLGLLDSSYKAVADKAFAGIRASLMSNSDNSSIKLKNICRSAGLGASGSTYRDGTPQYYLFGKDTYEIATNEGKGVGPYIMACLEKELADANKTNLVVGFKNFPKETRTLNFSDIFATNDTDALNVTVTSSVQGFATVDNEAKTVTFNKGGTGSITATYGGSSSQYMAGEVYLQFNITEQVRSVTLSPSNITLQVGEKKQLNAQVIPSGTTSVNWSVEGTGVTVDANGLVTATAVTATPCKVYAKAQSNESVQDFCLVTVVPNGGGTTPTTTTIASWKSTGSTTNLTAIGSFDNNNCMNLSAKSGANVGTDNSVKITLTNGNTLKTNDVITIKGTPGKTSSSESVVICDGSGTREVGRLSTVSDAISSTKSTVTITVLAEGNGKSEFYITRAGGTTSIYVTELTITRTEQGTPATTFNKYISSAEWASLVPTDNVVVPDDVTVYYAKTGTFTGSKVTIVPISAGEIIAKDMGFIVNGAEGVHAFDISTETPTNITDNMLSCGKGQTITEGSLVFGQNYIDGVLAPGFFALSDYAINVPEDVVYIDFTKLGTDIQKAPRVISLAFDEQPTAINGTMLKEENPVIYNLKGQRVGKDYKGIVVINNKKMIKR
ncbi:MAG: glycoside hydrolase family 88 protein [Bacteroidaceae bacterium]|nr:glycoside hydrolase family 88 protein [Bacteroidaceae bacterium]